MSATYRVFDGEPWVEDPETGDEDVDETTWRPLDEQVVGDWLKSIDGIVRISDLELEWQRPTFLAQIFLERSDDGVLRSVDTTLHSSESPGFLDDLRDLLYELSRLADRLRARLYLAEHDELIASEAIDEHIESLR